MIAIPNMEKPKNCAECPIRIAELFGVHYDNDGKSHRIKITGCSSSKYNGNTLAEDRRLMYKDCPLNDIVTCGECKRSGTDGEHTFCMWLGALRKPTDFCSYGERRE